MSNSSPAQSADKGGTQGETPWAHFWVLFLRGKSIPPVGAGTHKSNLKGNSNFPRPEGAEDSPRPEGAEDPPPPEGRPKKEVTL